MAQTGDDKCDFLITDFESAFQQMGVNPSEWKHLGGEALNGYFLYKVLLFGIKSGPLVWGRAAAFLMRITAAVLFHEPARIQCYVDDPVLATCGPQATRDKVMWMTIVLWIALGYTLTWKKGQRGPTAEWIRALIQPWRSSVGTRGITITIPVEKFEKLNSLIQLLLDYTTKVPKAELRSFTGLMTWVANICPQCNAFCRMLWGALTADDKSWVFPKQVALPLRWLSKFVTDQTEPLQRNFRPPSRLHLCITFDGPPTGGGATLQVAMTNMSNRSTHPIAYFWKTQWTAQDEELLTARVGDPAS